MGLSLTELVAAYQVATVGSAFLDETQLLANLGEAVRAYCAYQVLGIAADSTDHASYAPVGGQQIAADTQLTFSEIEVIRPLWMLFNEKEISGMMELSRGMGVEQAMRSVAEVEMAIAEYQMRLPDLAFYEPVRSI